MLPIITKNNDISVIRNMSTDELKNELAKSLTITADYLTYIAGIWQELEYRGEDLSELRHGMMTYIPLIATRQLDARLVVNYAGQKTLLSLLSKLPIIKQRELAENDFVEITSLGKDNEKIVKKIPISEMKSAQVYQVFGDGYVRDTEQQYQNLLSTNKRQKSKKTKTYKITTNIKIDENNLIVAGKYGISIDFLEHLLMSLKKESQVN